MGLVAYCAQEQISFTRGRPYEKNDQCFVEQKHGAVVRQFVGYDRFEGEAAYRQLVELYRALRLSVNCFQPSLKLKEKRCDGTTVRRTYTPAQTPFEAENLRPSRRVDHDHSVWYYQKTEHLTAPQTPMRL